MLFNFHQVSKTKFAHLGRQLRINKRTYIQHEGMWYCYCVTSITQMPMFCGAGVTKNDAFIDYKSKYIRGLCVSRNHPIAKLSGWVK